MDYNNNNNQYWQQVPQPQPSVAPQQPPMTPQQPKQKGSKFGAGMVLGIFLGIAIAVVLAVGGVALYSSTFGTYLVLGGGKIEHIDKNKILDDETAAKIEEVDSYIDLYYNGEVDEKKLKDSMVAGMVSGLGDPYSVYYTPEEYADLQVSTSGTYCGIGAGLKQDPETKAVTVTKIYKGTPSEEAGMKKDDIILYVNDIEATSMELTALVQNIKGEEGTKVHIQIYRPSTKETLDFDIERRSVELPSIEGEMLSGGIGYIMITEFQTNTAEQFKAMVKDLENQGMKAMIVDVRDNPGGLLTSVTAILDQILPEGTTVYTEDKYQKQDVFKSDASCMNIPMAVLVNGNSASASEIFAGAIKDYKYGTLIGTKTFGKGIVQTIFPLKDQDALKVTTAKYFTPNGNFIHGVGIEPDITLEYEYTGDKDKEYDKQYDNQLQKAIEVLNEEMSK